MDLKQISPQEEGLRVDPRRDEDLEHWARRLGISKAELKRAAEQAGPRLGDIREHLIGGFTPAGPTS
jgi:hypothetical protein